MKNENEIYVFNRNKNINISKGESGLVFSFGFQKIKVKESFTVVITKFFGLPMAFEYNLNGKIFKISINVEENDYKWLVCKIDNFIYKPYMFLVNSIKKSKLSVGVCSCFIENNNFTSSDCFHSLFLVLLKKFFVESHKWVQYELMFSLFVKITLVSSPQIKEDLLIIDDFSNEDRLMKFDNKWNMFECFFTAIQNLYQYSVKNSIYIEHMALCFVCMIEKNGFCIFLCGHFVCWDCSHNIKKCCICKK